METALMENRSKTLTVRCGPELKRRIKVACATADVEINAALVAILEREYPAPANVRASRKRPAHEEHVA